MQASMYLNKLPLRFEPDDRILLCDPMIATGEPELSECQTVTSSA